MIETIVTGETLPALVRHLSTRASVPQRTALENHVYLMRQQGQALLPILRIQPLEAVCTLIDGSGLDQISAVHGEILRGAHKELQDPSLWSPDNLRTLLQASIANEVGVLTLHMQSINEFETPNTELGFLPHVTNPDQLSEAIHKRLTFLKQINKEVLPKKIPK